MIWLIIGFTIYAIGVVVAWAYTPTYDHAFARKIARHHELETVRLEFIARHGREPTTQEWWLLSPPP